MAVLPERETAMSHKHANLLRTILHDQHAANVHWREVESLLTHLGADIEPAGGARFRVRLNRIEAFLHHPHHSNTCGRNEIKALREFLSHAGISLSAYEEARGTRD
jgi:hypothetical protein